MKISRDTNGNKTVKITNNDLKTWRNPDVKGFSIQTNGNLPLTHSEGVTFTTENEIFNYINDHGTKRQQTIIGCNDDLTLQDFIKGHTYNGNKLFKSLSITDIEQLVEIIGGRKKDRVKSVLMYHLKSSNFRGVESRFKFNVKLNRWSYCAGQDYIYEMAQVRKNLLRGY